MSSHELDSVMLYIHPTLAIVGYVFVFLFAAAILIKGFKKKKLTGVFGLAAWLFTFLGLASGMLWAQTAWGSYWSWDPKETSTLLLFLSVSASTIMFFEGKRGVAKWFALAACVLVAATILVSFVTFGLHSF
ncbi:MAG: cytochrome c biogenesis protein CcsA [Candidatus Bathyarchaeia archaeon]|jgi:ABC-type transport system involved in cytochrome c biogenesis permease subunit